MKNSEAAIEAARRAGDDEEKIKKCFSLLKGLGLEPDNWDDEIPPGDEEAAIARHAAMRKASVELYGKQTDAERTQTAAMAMKILGNEKEKVNRRN